MDPYAGIEDPLDDNAMGEMVSILKSLTWRGPLPSFNNNVSPSKTEMEQCQQDIMEQRLQMTAFMEKSREMEEKISILETESGKSNLEIANLRVLLASERESKADMEARINYLNDEIETSLGSIITRIEAAEESIMVLNEGRSREGNDAMEVSPSLSNDIEVRFTDVNKNHARLLEDLQRVKESVEESGKRIQSNLEVSQLNVSKIHEVQKYVADELWNIRTKLKLPETGLKSEVPTPAIPKGANGSDKDIPVITVEDDLEDDVEERKVNAAAQPQKKSFTLSSVASRYKAFGAIRRKISSIQQKGSDPHSSTAPSSTIKNQNITHGRDATKKGGPFCICGKKYSNRLNLRAHIVYYTSEKKFLCSLCPQRFLWLSNLRTHQEKKHQISQPTVTRGCRKCGRTFKNKRGHFKSCKGGQAKKVEETSNAIAHSSTPPTSKSTKKTPRNHGRDWARRSSTLLFCLCGAEFVKISHLNNHIQRYAKKKYACKPCGKRYAFQCRLKTHFESLAHKYKLSSIRASKAASKSCKCQNCGKLFETVTELANHVKAIHLTNQVQENE